MTPYITLGDGQNAIKSDMASAIQELVDLATSEGASREAILEILTVNEITFEV